MTRLDVLHKAVPVGELLAAGAPPAGGGPGLAEVLAGLLLDAGVRGVSARLPGGDQGGVRVRGGQAGQAGQAAGVGRGQPGQRLQLVAPGWLQRLLTVGVNILHKKVGKQAV